MHLLLALRCADGKPLPADAATGLPNALAFSERLERDPAPGARWRIVQPPGGAECGQRPS